MVKSKCKTHVVPVRKVSKDAHIDSFCVYEDIHMAVYVERDEDENVVSVSVSIHED